jgi:hypothetical protein
MRASARLKSDVWPVQLQIRQDKHAHVRKSRWRPPKENELIVKTGYEYIEAIPQMRRSGLDEIVRKSDSAFTSMLVKFVIHGNKLFRSECQRMPATPRWLFLRNVEAQNFEEFVLPMVVNNKSIDWMSRPQGQRRNTWDLSTSSGDKVACGNHSHIKILFSCMRHDLPRA